MLRVTFLCLLCLACQSETIGEALQGDLQHEDLLYGDLSFEDKTDGLDDNTDNGDEPLFFQEFAGDDGDDVFKESDEQIDVENHIVEEVQQPIPPKPRITINGIPDYMNGKEPYSQFGGEKHPFHVAVSSLGFTLEVYNQDQKEMWDGDVQIFASQDLRVGNIFIKAFEDFSHLLACSRENDPMLREEQERRLYTRCWFNSVHVPMNPMVTIIAGFVNKDGIMGETDQITFEIRDLSEDLDPFEKEDAWLVLFSRDIMSHEVFASSDGTYDVFSMVGSNGVADFDEALEILGLLSKNQDFSARAKTMFIQKIREHVARIFGLDDALRPTGYGVRLRIYFEGDEGAPDPKDFREDGDFSLIAVGSDPDLNDIAQGTIGRAWIDWNNRGKEDDSVFNFGVFVTQIVRQVLKNPLGAVCLREISPVDGVPFGMFEGDEAFLDPLFDPSLIEDERLRRRAELFRLIMDFLSLGIATTLCHEMGHSLGLVPGGAPPEGLFGGMDGLNFTVSDAGYAHIDTPGLNIMQTHKVTSYLEFLDGEPRFNELNLAYLRRRIVVGSTAGHEVLPRSIASCDMGLLSPLVEHFMLLASKILGH